MFNVEKTQVRKTTALSILYTSPAGITGHAMLLIMFLMYTTAHRKIRRQSFETFWFTHHLVSALETLLDTGGFKLTPARVCSHDQAFFFLVALYFHAIGCFVKGALPGQPVKCLGYNSWQWCIGGGILYVFERLIRIVSNAGPLDLSPVPH